jgi:hypothetical protein
MLRVNPQLATGFDYNRDILHGYVDQNFLWFNICQEIIVTTMFNVVTQGESTIFFLNV